MNLLKVLKYNATQPRHPKGAPGSKGGQFAIKPGSLSVLTHSKIMRQAAMRGILASAKNRGKFKDPDAALKQIQRLEREIARDFKKKSTDKIHRMKDGRFTPERRDLHQKILAKRFEGAEKFKPPEGEKPHVLLLAGKPGAGKSSFGKGLKIYDPDKYFVLDSDSFKEEFPEYDPERPAYVHREASDLMNTAGVVARAMGLNVVYDMTMKKPPTDLVQHFKNHGYIVEMHHMKVSQETSQERAVYRWNNDHKDGKMGRLVPPSILTEMRTTDKVFSESKKLADHWTEYDHEELGKPKKIGGGGIYAVAKYLKTMFTKGMEL